jgi:hypothetical protein
LNLDVDSDVRERRKSRQTFKRRNQRVPVGAVGFPKVKNGLKVSSLMTSKKRRKFKIYEIRKLNSIQSAIQILTNTDHPIRPYFTNPNKLDEYAIRPKNPQPLFIRTAEYLGETQIDIRRIGISPRYNRPPWKSVNEKQFDVRLSARNQQRTL